MTTTKHESFEIIVVVSGQPERIHVKSNEHLEKVVREALKRSGNHGQAPSEWELRLESGVLLDLHLTIAAAHIKGGTTLFLNPKAGAGGEA